jgi:hypothetical protein
MHSPAVDPATVEEASMPSPSPATDIPSTLTVRAWPDAVIDAVGHDLRSAYVERFWLGILGPSSTWLLRRLGQGLEEHPDGFELDLATTATQLGLGHRAGRHSAFLRSIDRCCRFGAADRVDERVLRVRRKLPPLTRSQLERLPAPLQEAHRAWVDGPGTGLPLDQLRERARGLALSLLELGEDAEATERQLHRWRMHPAVAGDAVAWAVARRHAAATVNVVQGDLPPEAA